MQLEQVVLDELAALLRAVAARELVPRYTHVTRRIKADGSLLTEADLALQRAIATALAARWPEVPLLGEEMPAEEQRLLLQSRGAVWLLDPLDGTSNFAAGLPYFAISLALLTPEGVALGLVYDPMRDECFCARRGGGATLNGVALRPTTEGALADCLAIVDLKRLPSAWLGRLVAGPPYRSQRSFGAAALEWCWLAAGRCQLYLHGRQMPWDHAAGALILQEAGGALCRLDGAPLDYRHLAPSGVIAAGSASLLPLWYDWLIGL